MNITKVVIPAAGWGTRFLPITKAIPKEMLPLLNKPAIEYIVREGTASGITDFVIITTQEKEAIKNYFSDNPTLNTFLQEKNKCSLTADLDQLLNATTFTYINQEKALGLGHAISLARHTIGNDYFGVMLPDDIMIGNPAALAQLAALAHTHKAPVIAVQEVPREHISSYGVIAIKKQISDSLFEIESFVEKPAPADAPSSLAIVGRYILAPSLFESLATIKPSAGGELQLTDALDHSLKKGQRMLATLVQAQRFDIGNPLGWLAANNYLASHSR